MSNDLHLLAVYLHLAQASMRRNRLHVADRLLILAAVAAANLSLAPIAAYCRKRVLEHNAHHLIGHWPSVAEALLDDEFLLLLRQLRRRFPQEKAERLLATLGIQLGQEREVYASDYEYAAALLGTRPDELDRQFPDEC